MYSPLPAPGDDAGTAAVAAPALALDDVTVDYGGHRALSRVSLRIGAGERVALIGPSGAGKSTLLRLANTSLFPSAGAVHVLGRSPAALAPGALRALRARVGTIWQQLHLVPQASVLENVRMGRVGIASLASLALGGARACERALVAEVLGRVGIAAKLDQRVETLSGGEQQRVAVARALHQAPDLLLADEPLASVDPARASEVLALLLDAARGRTLVISTHQLEPVLACFPRVVGLRAGEVLFDLPRERVGAAELARLYRPPGAEPAGDAIAFAGSAALLRVAASTLPGDHLLPRVLPAFRERHPGTRVALSVEDTGAALDRLLAGEADLAFVGAREHRADLVFEDVLEDEIVLLAAPGLALPPGPLGAAALARLPRVDREPGSGTRHVVEAQLAAMGAALPPALAVVEAGSPAALVRAVMEGLGVGFASRRSVEQELSAGRLREVPVERLRVLRRVYAAARREAPPPEAGRTLVALLRDGALA